MANVTIGENSRTKTRVSCAPYTRTRGAGSAERPSGTTETTIPTLATRSAASLATCILLSCVLAPAAARQPASHHLAAGCEAGKACAAARQRGTKQAPECGRLRAAILEAEQSERRVRAAMMESVQLDLLSLRKRYRKLGCRD